MDAGRISLNRSRREKNWLVIKQEINYEGSYRVDSIVSWKLSDEFKVTVSGTNQCETTLSLSNQKIREIKVQEIGISQHSITLLAHNFCSIGFVFLFFNVTGVHLCRLPLSAFLQFESN